jgi:hypothetical protein
MELKTLFASPDIEGMAAYIGTLKWLSEGEGNIKSDEEELIF